MLVTGYIVFSAVYLGFAFASSQTVIIAAFVLYGIYTAMITGVERAFIAEISPKELKGTMLGMHSTIVGVALLPASVIAGLLWTGLERQRVCIRLGDVACRGVDSAVLHEKHAIVSEGTKTLEDRSEKIGAVLNFIK